MAKAGLFVVTLAVLFCGAPAHAWIPGVYLEEPGARAAGMGGCFVSVADDAWAAAWNPAGLAFLRSDVSVAGGYQRVLPEWDVSLWCSSAAVRTAHLGSFAGTVEYLTYQEVIHSDPEDPDPGGGFTPNELSWSFSYAYALLGRLGLGGTVKRLRVYAAPDELVMHGSGTAFAWAFDAGVLYKQEHQLGLGAGILRLGASVLHVGEDLSFRESGGPDPEPLPARWKAGASYGVDSGRALRGLLCVETTWPIEQYEEPALAEEHPTIGAGLELALGLGGGSRRATAAGPPRGEVIGRIGYVRDDDEELSGLSFGFGAALRSHNVEFRIDFANSPRYGELDRPWQLGCAIGLWL